MHLVALCLFIEHGIEGRGTFLRLALLLERRPKFPDARTVPRSGSAHQFLRCEIGRCGRPRAPRRNLGTRDLANMGARAAQNPEPRHQVAVTRLDVHHTVGGSHTDRPIKGSDRSRSARQRPAEGDSAVTTTNTLEARSVDIVYDVDGPPPTAHGRSPLFMIGQPKDASGFRILPETAEFGRPPRLAARAFHASGIRLRSPGSVLPPHTITATRSRAAGR